MNLTVRGLSARYGSVTVLRDANLEVDGGNLVALIGANGAGKSTLMRSIAGLHGGISGSIQLDGREIARTPAHKVASLGLALVPEGRHLFPELTVLENIRMGFSGIPGRPAERAERLTSVFDMFPILEKFTSRVAGELSGGQQQMLALARSLVRRPRVLLLDEPSLGLAPLLVTQILEIAQRLAREDGVAVLLAEQNAAAALRVADTGAIIENGRIVRTAAAAELLADEDVSAHYLGARSSAANLTREPVPLPSLLRSRTLQ